MILPQLPRQTVIDIHAPTGIAIYGFDKNQMLEYGKACQDAVIEEIEAKIESMRNAQN